MNIRLFGLEEKNFDSLHVAALGRPEDLRSVRDFVVHTSAVCTPEQALIVAELWNSLPDGMQSRCHMPGYALQVIIKGEIVFTAAICWQCNNVSISGKHATAEWRNFDAESGQAQKLLQLCEKVTQNAS